MVQRSQSVGIGAPNLPIDVAVVQDLLNRALPMPFIRTAIDGEVTTTLYDRIGYFQQALSQTHPDRVVSRNGATFRGLTSAAAPWKQNPILNEGSADWGNCGKLPSADAFVTLYGRRFKTTPDGLKTLVSHIAADTDISDARWAAYMLATAWRECNFKPIKEYGSGQVARYRDPAAKTAVKLTAADVDDTKQAGRANGHPLYKTGDETYGYGDKITFVDASGQDHANVYYGRGYVQITWWFNYLSFGKNLGYGEQFVSNPDTVL